MKLLYACLLFQLKLLIVLQDYSAFTPLYVDAGLRKFTAESNRVTFDSVYVRQLLAEEGRGF